MHDLLYADIRNTFVRRFGEAILMSTYNICFYGEISKIILELSPTTLLICPTVTIVEIDHKKILLPLPLI